MWTCYSLDRITRTTLIVPVSEGGLNMLDIDIDIFSSIKSSMV